LNRADKEKGGGTRRLKEETIEELRDGEGGVMMEG
jgi:hypothetical protein